MGRVVTFFKLLVVPLLVVGVAAMARDSASSAATQYTNQVGGGKNSVSVEEFRPRVIFVNQGDTVQFVNNYEEIHTVTFLAGKTAPDLIIPAADSPKSGPPKLVFNPQAALPVPQSPSATFDGTAFEGSGILNKGDSWTVTFTTLGTFPFLCLVHPGMTGSLEVLPPGVHVPTQAQRDYEAQGQLDAGLAKGEQAAAAVVTGKTANANGSSTWAVQTGPSVGQVDVLRFIPAQLNVGVGDTVNWTNNTGVPHTVSFLSGTPDQDLVLPQPQPGGPPQLLVNPQVLFPTKPSQNYDGTGFFNSGFITTDPALSTGGTSFSLTFTKAGTYTYLCFLHDDQGMVGTVVVGPSTGVRPPSTGDGGLATGPASLRGHTRAYMMALAAMLAFAPASLVTLRRRAR